MSKAIFLENLRRAIEARPDLSISSVSVRAGLSNSTVRKWFEGAAEPSLANAERVAAAAGTSLAALITPGLDPLFREVLDLWCQLDPAERRVLRASLKAISAQRQAGD